MSEDLWPEVPFNELYEIPSKNGISPPKETRGTGYKMINMGELFAYPRLLSPEMILVPMTESEIDRFQIVPYDLLFARRSLKVEGAGKCTIVMEVPSITTFESSIIRVRLDQSHANPSFYFYYFASPPGRTKMSAIINKHAVAGIKGSDLAQITVPLPDISEQKIIANVFHVIDDMIDISKKRMNAITLFKQGLMQRLLTRGIGHTRFKKTKIGEIPESWKLQPIANLAEYINGYAFKPSDWEDKGYPIIRIKQLNDSKAEMDYYSGKLDSKYLIESGDLLFSWSGTLGSYIWNRGRAYVNQHIFKVVPMKGVSKYFLHYLLDYSVPDLISYSHGSTMKHIKKGVLKQFLVGVPPLTEQKKITSNLELLDNLLSQEKQITENLEYLKKGLMQVLLTGKVRVKV